MQNALFDDLCNCSTYYSCVELEDGSWALVTSQCPPGTAFNPDAGFCDAPSSVPGCENAARRIVQVRLSILLVC